MLICTSLIRPWIALVQFGNKLHAHLIIFLINNAWLGLRAPKMAKIKVFGLFLEMKSLVLADFPHWSSFLLWLTTGPKKKVDINVFCLISRIDAVNTCKIPFSCPFFFSLSHRFSLIFDRTTACNVSYYLVVTKLLKNYLVQISHINGHLYV